MTAAKSPDLLQNAVVPLQRVRALSRAMAVLCVVTSVVLGAGLLVYWLVTPVETVFLDARLPGGPLSEMGWGIRFAAIMISATPLACLVWGLMQARRCFLEFTEGRFFTLEVIHGLRGFAVAVFASALLKPVVGAALSVLLSWGAGPGKKALVLSLGSDTLLSLLFAGTIAIIAWVMTEALAVADENAQFI
jgi:DUF2975 family protein